MRCCPAAPATGSASHTWVAGGKAGALGASRSFLVPNLKVRKRPGRGRGSVGQAVERVGGRQHGGDSPPHGDHAGSTNSDGARVGTFSAYANVYWPMRLTAAAVAAGMGDGGVRTRFCAALNRAVVDGNGLTMCVVGQKQQNREM